MVRGLDFGRTLDEFLSTWRLLRFYYLFTRLEIISGVDSWKNSLAWLDVIQDISLRNIKNIINDVPNFTRTFYVESGTIISPKALTFKTRTLVRSIGKGLVLRKLNSLYGPLLAVKYLEICIQFKMVNPHNSTMDHKITFFSPVLWLSNGWIYRQSFQRDDCGWWLCVKAKVLLV